MIDSTLSQAGFHPMRSKGTKASGFPLFNYSTNGKMGYLRISSCVGTRFHFTGSLKSLDIILKEFKNTEGLIIDLRFNPGGYDNFSFKVAGRFTNKEYLGHYKQNRIKGDSLKFSELKPYFIKPRGNRAYEKPVVVLTNDVTVSAADVMALILSELPQVIILGENTNGSFSDMYTEKLPNGWKVTLSKERYLSAQKVNYEGKGVPVDIEVLNMRKDIELKSDTVLKRAFAELRKKTK